MEPSICFVMLKISLRFLFMAIRGILEASKALQSLKTCKNLSLLPFTDHLGSFFSIGNPQFTEVIQEIHIRPVLLAIFQAFAQLFSVFEAFNLLNNKKTHLGSIWLVIPSVLSVLGYLLQPVNYITS